MAAKNKTYKGTLVTLSAMVDKTKLSYNAICSILKTVNGKPIYDQSLERVIGFIKNATLKIKEKRIDAEFILNEEGMEEIENSLHYNYVSAGYLVKKSEYNVKSNLRIIHDCELVFSSFLSYPITFDQLEVLPKEKFNLKYEEKVNDKNYNLS